MGMEIFFLLLTIAIIFGIISHSRNLKKLIEHNKLIIQTKEYQTLKEYYNIFLANVKDSTSKNTLERHIKRFEDIENFKICASDPPFVLEIRLLELIRINEIEIHGNNFFNNIPPFDIQPLDNKERLERKN
jgi:hypothetical protein